MDYEEKSFAEFFDGVTLYNYKSTKCNEIDMNLLDALRCDSCKI